MGKPTGFMEIPREGMHKRAIPLRVRDWREVYEPFPVAKARDQGARCMDCGIPFCHQGCPLGNMIPDWNDLVYRDHWREALDRLHATNNFPEFTGRLCPAPCESSCVLGINADPVTIKLIEVGIIDRAWEEGWVRPEPPRRRTGKQVAVIGSGPAGLACAQQLARAGHEVTVFERADRVGGLLRYGIPEFKMEKRHLERRIEQMTAEGVRWSPGVNAGEDITAEELRRQFDAIVLAGGATAARDLPIPGRDLKGIYQAMHFLPMANRYSLNDAVEMDGRLYVKPTPPYDTDQELIPYAHAGGKKVIIVGGGDTGADCLGTVHRQGCASVAQFEIVPRPPDERAPDNPWPQFLMTLANRSQPAHDEGGRREFQINTKEFLGDAGGNVRALRTTRVDMVLDNGRMQFVDVPGSEEVWEADLVLFALGFLGPEKSRLLADLGVAFDARGNVKADGNKMTSVPGVFVAGDMTRGQSLIVWAIAEGRQAAAGVDAWLMGSSDLPRPLDHGNDERPFL
jgi:glutamate synthase (NADPH/NADH) small chain